MIKKKTSVRANDGRKKKILFIPPILHGDEWRFDFQDFFIKIFVKKRLFAPQFNLPAGF